MWIQKRQSITAITTKKLGKTTAHRFPNPSRLSLPAKVQLNGKKRPSCNIWVFPKMVVPPKHPKIIIFSRKTMVVGYPHFRKPPFHIFFWGGGNKGISLPQLPFGGPRSRFRSRANLTRSIKRYIIANEDPLHKQIEKFELKWLPRDCFGVAFNLLLPKYLSSMIASWYVISKLGYLHERRLSTSITYYIV